MEQFERLGAFHLGQRRGAGVLMILLARTSWRGLVLVALAAGAAHASGTTDGEMAASGLREALSVGTGRAVALLGQANGYLDNKDVRIPMPEKLRVVDKGLRRIGRADLVDEFVVSMNRAAEAAAPSAKPIVVDAIKQMTFQEAVKILRGRGHEATDYLSATSRAPLAALFEPIVGSNLDAVGCTRAFDQLMKRYGSLPLSRKPTFDLRRYVTDRALDGVFLMIAREEESIRRDPAARTTDILKRVFGGLGSRAGGTP